ncbi:MAG: endonuclease/exonuclease/phosphatase family protein [Rhizobiaceae bacterium]|nr:endonuclease/exonuclease/phosphatase family protein [Rhizobiaceae bacterium]
MIRVASYNIRKSLGLDRKRNPLRILDVLNEIDADVVFLQEVDRRMGKRASTLSPELIAKYTDYEAAEVAVREHSLGWHGNVILARKGMEIEKAWRIDLPVIEPRGAVAADINLGGRSVRCVATHLGLLARIRKQQVRKIITSLHDEPGDLPTIIAGDFNEWRNSESCIDLFSENYRSIDPEPSFHSALPVVALDRIIVSRDINFLKTSVHTSKKSKIASDHLPLWADISLPKP